MFFQRCHISMYIQSRWCIQPLSTFSFLWCSTKKWSWKILKDQNFSVPPHYQVWHIYFQPWLNERSLHSNRFQRCFKEVSIGQDPEQIGFYDDLKWIHLQYGLHHYVTGTIHGAKGDTYNRMVISVSDTENIFSSWDLGQLIVIFSRTRIMKNNIFVGPKNETICGMKLLLNQRTQWCDYIE